jgi:DNA topoisomerase-1
MNRTITEYFLKIQFGGKIKWENLSHNGLVFPKNYIPHKIPLKYNNTTIELSPLAEEEAMLYVKYFNTEYINNKSFKKNFWNDWKKTLGHNSPIKTLENCDFTEYYNYYIENKNDKSNGNNTNETYDKYKTAIVDGKEQPIGNFRIEPPGLFIGRGNNPLLGKIKKRIYPEDITINIGIDAEIPESLPNHKWKKIIHDRNVEWLASWKDTITNKTKYVWLGAHSDFKANSDLLKFDLARKLKKRIKKINATNFENLQNEDPKMKQIATALYFIDKLALRVGNEKTKDETDTVGVTSLRIEHVKLKENNEIILDFLGKDSVRYFDTVKVEKIVYQNIINFIKDKKYDDQLFDKINANDINKYLQTFMKGLTAKVFRTYNASHLFQKEINKIYKSYDPNLYKQNTEKDKGNSHRLSILLDEFNKANAKVAKLCNHQKNIGKSFKGQIVKIDDILKKMKIKLKKLTSNSKNKTKQDSIQKIQDSIKKYKSKKELKMDLKNISLGTSKTNYIDPRITVMFMKSYNLPVEKVFTTALRNKFNWAFDVHDFSF